nr:hypothetical protein [Candidatus Microthrix sp.]
RNLLEETMACQASRVVALDGPTRDDLALLTAADIPATAPGHRAARPPAARRNLSQVP